MRNTFSTFDMDAIKRSHEEWCRAHGIKPDSPAAAEKALQMLASYKPEAGQPGREGRG
ncbi:hypothetical protein LAC81_37365 (plasmid) [Ensifer adhaerens]|uniref:hypothetical protein n=1 Tax=Ensifer adhaerens TaxID=106592 RepID=UPI001CBF41B8|nr:hypothetical protein [Ensifer adhaerens]MBZ7927611.1 hypothetical protein [Ensifer adhaerens]UAX98013.1 hypothetical protein LAC78_38670 [Ensifer adhaerens]UAY05393.1 hypothetical protein LAC80_37380 [Ensifer adhaerens]UAY12771.1 hypothetical protein LAC81_37365 [Ensifer adhaerens]